MISLTVSDRTVDDKSQSHSGDEEHRISKEDQAMEDWLQSFRSKLQLNENTLQSTDGKLREILRRHQKEVQELPQRHVREIQAWKEAT